MSIMAPILTPVTVVPLIIGGMLAIPADAPAALRTALAVRYIVPNPAYRDALEHDRSTSDLDEKLYFHDYGRDGSLLLPRGDTEQALRIARAHGVTVTYDDQTAVSEPLGFTEHVTLSPWQEEAVRAALKRRYGVIEAPPGAGKTVMGLVLIARRRQRALWIVHTKELALQAIARAEMVLGLTRASGAVGLYGGGCAEIGSHVTVALVQTLAMGIPPALLTVGHVVLDEAHHAPARTVAEVLRRLPARYLLGLTATPYRRDGLDAVIGWHLGPTVARIDAKDLADRLVTPRVVKRTTGIRPRPYSDGYAALVSELVGDEDRNALIVADVAEAVREGHRCLVLSDRVGHARTLARLLKEEGVSAATLHGGMGVKERARVVSQLASGELRAVTATCSLVGEGFDSPTLDRLFLATPLSWAGRVRQYVGRVARTASGKTDAVVTDYADDHPMLWSAWGKRAAVYRADGLRIAAMPALGAA